MIYFDNAATSGPKPERVLEAVCDCMKHANANPGRSGHSLAVKAAELIYKTREAIGELFNFPHTQNIVLTKNATEALNIALYGSLRKGDQVITTSMEHNSVMRPLCYLKDSGMIDMKILHADSNGKVSAEQIQEAINDRTRLVAVTAASNVTGTIMPLKEIFRITNSAGVKLLVDGAQGAGSMQIDIENTPFDFLAITGHKHLYGPQGTGALIVRNPEELDSFMRGGTGSLSEKTVHPDFPPDKFEAGTLNTPGYAGLAEGISYILKRGLGNLIAYERHLTEYLIEKLLAIEEIEIYAPHTERVATVSFNIRNAAPSEVSHYLDSRWGICARPGLHCAPEAHRTLGTFPKGTLRFSLACFNTEQEIDIAAEALNKFIRNT
jgi:cysteine desulfurase / selenocysteine lyase